MPRLRSGKWYAQAVFELARERNDVEDWTKALEEIATAFRDERLIAFLENPKILFEAKRQILQERLSGIPPLALNLVLLLIRKGELRLAEEIAHQYRVLLDATRGIEHAEVITAVPIKDGDEEMVRQQLGRVIGKDLVLETRVDPSVIGGFIARVGDMLIDGSIRQRLDSLKKSMSEVAGS